MCKISWSYTVPIGKTLIATVNCLRLFVVVNKLINLICRCGVTVVVLFMYAVLYAHRNCYSKGIRLYT